MIKRGTPVLFSLGLAAAALISSGDSFAQSSQTTTGSTPVAASTDSLLDGWEIEFSPYAWVTAISANSGFRGVDTHVQMSMGDVLEDLDGALMFSLVGRKDEWSVNSDLIYAALSDSGNTPRDIVFDDAEVDMRQILWTQSIGYSVYNTEDITADLTAGFRLASVYSELELDGSELPSGEQVANRILSDNKIWVDPVIGARGRIALVENFFAQTGGDIGGFRSSSSFTWQAVALIGYELCPNSSIGAGYRALGYNHDRDGFKYNATLYGPFIGAQIKF